jgi:hypothetical protein
MAWVVALLAFMGILTRSTGAIILGVGCLAAMYQLRWIRQPILLFLLLIFAPIQMSLRTTVLWKDPVVLQNEANDPNEDPDIKERKASLRFREINEAFMIRKIWNQPYLGYGDTGLGSYVPEMKVHKEDTDHAVTDSFWIITLTSYGAVGLIAIYAAMLLPVARYMYYYKPYRWDQPLYAPGAVLALIVLLWMLDNLYNGFFNAMYVLAAGALFSVTGTIRAAPRLPAAKPAQLGRPTAPLREVKPISPPPGAIANRPGVFQRGRPLSR